MLSKHRSCSILTVHFKHHHLTKSHIHNTPQSTHYSSISKALKNSAKNKVLKDGKKLHAHVIKLGHYTLLSVRNQILHVYVKCKNFHSVRKLFDEIPDRNVVSWNTVICGVVSYGGGDLVSNLEMSVCYFKRMMFEMGVPDYLTFNGLILGCVGLNSIFVGEQLHCFVVKYGLYFDPYVSGALVDLYAKCGLVRDARLVFDVVMIKDLVLWNVMVSCYSLNLFAREAFGVYNLMQVEGVKGDEFTFTSLLSSCSGMGSCDLGTQIHSRVIRLSYDSDVLLASALVDMYAKNENIDDAQKSFNEMVNKNVVSWTTMIVGYGQHGDAKEALKLFRDMLREAYVPDELTLASVFSSCGQLSSANEIIQIHAYTIKNGFQSFQSVVNALINAYSKSGNISNVIQYFSSIADPDIFTWTSMLNAYAFHGLLRKCIEVFEKVLSHGMRPDRIAFLSVLSACSHGGLVQEGLHYFDLMTHKFGILLDSDHYTCLIDLLARAGFLDTAFKILTSIEPGSNALGAFIGACKVHGNIEYTEWAAEKLFKLEPNKNVNYALMSNAYALAGCWADVARVRKMMRDACDHKVIGCSWIEIAGEVCTFVSSDKSQLQAIDIYTMLGILVKMMKKECLYSVENICHGFGD